MGRQRSIARGGLSRLALGLGGALVLGAALIALAFMAVFGQEGRPGGGQADCAPSSPADVAALEAWMAAKVPDSPLVDLGEVFVEAGEAHGLDPRALVAIAHHESLLGTAGSGADINNAFGWGPGIVFASWPEGINTVAEGLGSRYVGRGHDTLADIAPVWAPIGAENDPTNLNVHWLPRLRDTYQELGGDPDGSIALAPGQVAIPVDDAGQQTAPVAQAGPAPEDGGDGRTPVSVVGFTFPVRGQANYTDDYLGLRGSGSHCPGTTFHCATDVFADRGTPVLAPIAGVVVRMASSGLGGNHLTIEGTGERFYLAHFDAFADGIADAARVEAGQEVGYVGTTGSAVDTPPHLHIAWSHLRDGVWSTLNPYYLLKASESGQPIAVGGCEPTGVDGQIAAAAGAELRTPFGHVFALPALGGLVDQVEPQRVVTTPAGRVAMATFDGKPVSAWWASMLSFARQQGWRGSLTSGYRSHEEQWRIWNANPNPTWVARPGSSPHEYGMAVDISDGPGLEALIREYRLPITRYAPEGWHFEPVGFRVNGTEIRFW